MKQAADKGYEGSWFDPVSQLTSKRIPELSGGAAVGMLASTPQSAGDIESFQAFLDAYKTKNGQPLDDPTYTGFGYDALMNLAAAMGPPAPPPTGPRSRPPWPPRTSPATRSASPCRPAAPPREPSWPTSSTWWS